MQEKYKGLKDPGDRPVTVSGLASEGKILFPLQKDKEAVKVERELSKNRTNLIAAARNGDEEAMESLTMEDMDTYSMISQRIVTDDVLTIVDSYFMPYGIECDQYNVLGEILDIMKFKNILTGEEICQMTIESNVYSLISASTAKIFSVNRQLDAASKEQSGCRVSCTIKFSNLELILVISK